MCPLLDNRRRPSATAGAAMTAAATARKCARPSSAEQLRLRNEPVTGRRLLADEDRGGRIGRRVGVDVFQDGSFVHAGPPEDLDVVAPYVEPASFPPLFLDQTADMIHGTLTLQEWRGSETGRDEHVMLRRPSGTRTPPMTASDGAGKRERTQPQTSSPRR